MSQVLAIEGSDFSDERGKMKFFNTFDMKEIVRFYEISPASVDIIRGWQGHKKEKQWLYCHTGSFIFQAVPFGDDNGIINNNTSPSTFELNADIPLILEVGPGMATAFKSNKENSKLMVFSNFTLEESKGDDFRFELDTWETQW